MTDAAEQAMHDAIRGLVAADEGDGLGRDVTLVIRSVTIAEVLLADEDKSALTTVITGDMPNWATIGMLRATLALAEAAHLDDATEED